MSVQEDFKNRDLTREVKGSPRMMMKVAPGPGGLVGLESPV